MIEDFVRSRGYLTLGTRLKRIGERMQSDVADVSTQLGMPIAGGLLTALGAIEAHGSLSVNGLAEALGISQPAATKLAARLAGSGLIVMNRDPADKRSRVLVPTTLGATTVRHGQMALWPAVEAAVRELCVGLAAGGALLETLDALEDALAAKSLRQRIEIRLRNEEDHHDSA